MDIATISRWLGHKDGRGLVLRVYRHLRAQHSAEKAKMRASTANALKSSVHQTRKVRSGLQISEYLRHGGRMKPDHSGDRGALSLSPEICAAASRFVAAYDSINWDALTILEVDCVELFFDSPTAKAECATFIQELESACPKLAAFEDEKHHEILANISVTLEQELEWIAALKRRLERKPARRVEKWIAEHKSLAAKIRKLAADCKRCRLKLQRKRQEIPASYRRVAEIRTDLFSLLTQLVSVDHARSARFQDLQTNVPTKHHPTAPAARGVAGPPQGQTEVWGRRQLELECSVTDGAQLPQESLLTQWIRLSVLFGGYARWFAKQIASVNTKIAMITLPVAGRELLEKYLTVFHGDHLRRYCLPVQEADSPENDDLHMQVESCFNLAGEFVTVVSAGSTADARIAVKPGAVGESARAITDGQEGSLTLDSSLTKGTDSTRDAVNNSKPPNQPGTSHSVVIEKDCSITIDGQSLPRGCQQHTSLLAINLLVASEQPNQTLSTHEFIKLCFHNPRKNRSKNFSQRMKFLRQNGCPNLVVDGHWKEKSIRGLRFDCSASADDIKGFLQTHKSGQDQQD